MPRHFMRRWVPNGKLIPTSGLVLSLVFTLVFSLAPLSRAQDGVSEDAQGSPVRVARISFVAGEVRLDSGQGYESATMNVPVTEHNWLQTRSDGWAEVQMEDGSLVRLAPDTIIGFTQLSRLSSGAAVTVIDLDQGEAEFKILKHNGSDFQVTVNNKTIALEHTGFFRVTSTNDDPMELAVWKGDLSVHDGESGEEVAVRKNETFVLDPNDPGRYALEPGPQGDELDEWSKQRDSSLSAYAAVNHNTQSPYQYGASDLGAYGQFTEDPEYGNVWQPNGVSQDWDPFSNGYYANSGLGATFVSAYPWGWMPYRYGRWVFIGGRGWFWAPGGWNKLNTLPRIVNAPPGFHAPIPPANLKVVGRAPGQVIRPGEIAGNGGGRNAGSGRSFSENAGGQSSGRLVADKGSRHVFTNDEVQTIPPHTDSVKTKPAIGDAERRTRGFEQEGTNGPAVQRAPNSLSRDRLSEDRLRESRTNENRANENRLPPRRPNATPSVPRPVRQSVSVPQQRASSEVVHERDRVREEVPLSQLPSVVEHSPVPGHEQLPTGQPTFLQNPPHSSGSYGSSAPSNSSNESPRSKNR